MKNSIKRAVFVGLSVLLQAYWIFCLIVWLNDYSVYLQMITSLFALLTVLRIYGRHINSAYKFSWIILILVAPLLGLCLYMLCGRTGAVEALRKNIERVDRELDGSLIRDDKVMDDFKKSFPQLYGQAYYLSHTCNYPLYENTDIEFYGNTSDALEAQKEELKKAEHFIFMEYHAIQDSVAWMGIEDILAERAKAGVDVRVIYDDMGSIGFINKSFIRHLNERGIACRVFNPLIPILTVIMNNRDHRKITSVDGKVGFTGGYNLADEYFNLTHPFGEWKDSGVRLEGDAVRSLTVIFLEMWGAMQKEPIDPKPFLPQISYTSKERSFVQPYADSPMDDENVAENVYLNILKNAQDYVYITTPYLILSDEMNRELTLAKRRGVDIRIITPGIPDKKLVYKTTRSYYAALAKRGVRIYEYTPGFIHAKQYVSDDITAEVGTINMDFRSLYLHFENGCLFFNCEAVKKVREDFEELFKICNEVTEKYSADRPVTQRGLQCILRLLAPLF